MNPSVYSNAFNFASWLSGHVDARTGQYNACFRLAVLQTAGPVENHRDIILSFSMMNTLDVGFGIGWSISTTQLVTTSNINILTLMTGERYRLNSIPPIDFDATFKDHKLKDLVVRQMSDTEIQLLHVDGMVEILRRTSSSSPYKLGDLRFENGETFRFYEVQGRLECIRNLQTGKNLLTINYQTASTTSIDVAMAEGHTSRAYFFRDSNRLTRMTVPVDVAAPPDGSSVDWPAHVFQYRSPFANGLIAIETVSPPYGGRERVTYRERGHAFANGQYIPCVESLAITPGLFQPEIVRHYKYSPENFTGYPFTSNYLENEDNLYLKASDYVYWTEETVFENERVVSILKTTYNKFHLLTEEEVRRSGTRTLKQIGYNILPGVLFPGQPANLQMPRIITTRYELSGTGASRVETTQTETDEFGNTLSHIEVSGKKFQYDYYPTVGEPEKCPADPLGRFQRFVKTETEFPAKGDREPRITGYTYHSLPLASGSGSWVLTETTDYCSTVHTRFEHKVDSQSSALHGRLRSLTMTMNGRKTVTEFDYTVDADILTEARKITGYDGSWFESGRTLTLSTRQLLSIHKEDGVRLAFTYDVLGRVESEVASPGTAREATRHYSYKFSDTQSPASVIATDALGNRCVTRYDGRGRPISWGEVTSGTDERLFRRVAYDVLDRKVSETIVDYLGANSLTLITGYVYNGWGEVSRIVNPDGTKTIREFDPLENCSIEGVEGLDKKITYYNEFGQPKSIVHVSSSGERRELISRTYDGFGRCILEKDVDGNESAYDLDIFDRAILAVVRPIDKSTQRAIATGYAPHSGNELSVSCTINAVSIGAREYDGVGRLIEERRGSSVASSYSYRGGFGLPAKVDLPGGIARQYEYDVELGAVHKVTVAGQSDSQFEYETNGLLKAARAVGSDRELTYDRYQHLQSERRTVNGKTEASDYIFSSAGRLLSYKTALDTETRDYDGFGRLEKIAVRGVTVAYRFDAYSRIDEITTSQGSKSVKMTLTFDAFGREATRMLEQNTNVIQMTTSQYHRSGRLSMREIKMTGGTAAQESFDYDAFGRLVEYGCSGALGPVDRQGRRILSQSFEYDTLDNIRKVTTAFQDGTRDTCSRFFSASDPTQLTTVQFTNPAAEYVLTYDESGNLLSNGQGLTFSYDGLGRLLAATTSGSGQALCSYQYDAEGRQVAQLAASETHPVAFEYSGDQIVGQRQGDESLRYLRDEEMVLALAGGAGGSEFNVIEQSGSVSGVFVSNLGLSRKFYTPYGCSPVDASVPGRPLIERHRPAFNGERLDPLTNLYHLGNGRRAYSPELMIFLSPDPLSPFGRGGINSYAYCHGDPINLSDPSGLWGLWESMGVALGGLVLGILSFGFATPAVIAAITVSSVIGIAGATLGVVSGTLAVAAIGVSMVDEQKGWNRSGIVDNLNKASLWIGVGSMVAGIGSGALAAKSTFAARTGLRVIDFPVSGAVGERGSAISRFAMGGSFNRAVRSAASFVGEFIGFGAELPASKAAGFAAFSGLLNFGAGLLATLDGFAGVMPSASPYADTGDDLSSGNLEVARVDALGTMGSLSRANGAFQDAQGGREHLRREIGAAAARIRGSIIVENYSIEN